MKFSYKISLEAHIESVKLEDEIIKTISDELGQLKLSIDTLKTDIAENSEQVDVLEKQAEDILEEKPPVKMDAIEKIIDEISSKLERNKELLDFSQRWLEYLLRDSGLLSKHLAKYINLVCATTVGIASDEYFGDGKPLEQKQFDLLIVDEAGKVTEPEFLVAATRAKRWVIVGDHKQLPPYYDRKLNKIFSSVNRLRNSKDLPLLNSEPLQVSYFENLWKKLYFDTTESDKAKSRFVQLDVQRRMHPDLALFISDMFYDNQYTSPDGPEFIRKKTLKLSRFDHAVTLIEVCPGKNQNYFEINLSHSFERKKLNLPQQTGYANLEEAKKVIEVLTSILMEDSIYTEQQELNEENDSSAAIGIMAFYAGQVELIRRLIRDNKTLDAQELSGNGQFIFKGSVTVVVNSVDSFQGKECSIIILSFTRSNPYHNIGFVDDANRLNVAMSRARKKLILIGDRKTFTRRAHTDDRNINGNDSESIKAERLFFEKLVEYIEGRGEIKKIFQLLEDNK
jgi:superfamily I DNA and/or RNA helicase